MSILPKSWLHKSRRMRFNRRQCRRFIPLVERLESRRMLAITASFSVASGLLTVRGDGTNNTIEISRNAAGAILVNGGAISISGGSPTVANTSLIQAFGLGGNDSISLNETSGALPRAYIFGGGGGDNLTGGSGVDRVFGQAGDDDVFGRGGFDALYGLGGNDDLTGGDADDQVFGGADNDQMIWNPGDDTDLNEGGIGLDTTTVNGGGGAEVFTTTANGARVRFDRLDPAPFSLDIGTTENLVLIANGGNDSFSATGNLAALIQIAVDGGAGDDTLLGSNGGDFLVGGDNNDFVDGQQGGDIVYLGAGDDVFQWDPGDGSDTVDGEAGTDRLIFNGSSIGEIMDIAPNGSRVRLTRNIGNIVMDLEGIETFDVNVLGGADTLTVGNLTGTAATTVNAQLAGTIGGTIGDGLADTVIVNGTGVDDTINVLGAGTSASVVGLAAQVNVTNSEGANDSLVVNSLGGDDNVTATTLPAGVIKLTADGGAGEDSLLGSQGADVFLGGNDNDFIFGDNGDDVAFMGVGNDVFQWDPGDGNDTLEGQDGADTMLFFGANNAENITISPNGGRVIFFRDIATVTMDLDDVEGIDFRALGGADNIVVGDLTGTDMTQIGLDLRGPAGGGDGAADTVTVNGTQGADVFGAVGNASGVNVFGLHTVVNLYFQEQANDRLVLNALGEADVVDATSLEADGIQLTMNGGLGADVFLGSEGNDLISGGDGDDIALMGAGDDTFVWNPGDDNDTLEGQAGNDTMTFNGANIAENITISPNGGRVIFFRDIASVTMDLDDVETINFNALGGADTIVVNDLTVTDIAALNFFLASTIGGNTGDAQADSIIVSGTGAADTIALSGGPAGTSVFLSAYQINITTAESANDRLTINSLGGDDVVDASAVDTGAIQLTLNGGDEHDTLIGGDGADTIFGGNGDDVLIGGLGLDILDGGPGDNVVIQ